LLNLPYSPANWASVIGMRGGGTRTGGRKGILAGSPIAVLTR
jgi:hypothetical protein